MAKISGKQLLQKELDRYKYIAGAKEREVAKLKILLESKTLQVESASNHIVALCKKLGQAEVEITKGDILDAMKSKALVRVDAEKGSFFISIEGEQKCE